MNSPTGKSGFATTPLDSLSPAAIAHSRPQGLTAARWPLRCKCGNAGASSPGGLSAACSSHEDLLAPHGAPTASIRPSPLTPGQASRCALMANTGSLGFARPRVLPSCWRRYLPPTARAWLPVSGWGARAARTSADIVAPCGVGQTRRRRWPWRRTFGASRDRSSARGSVGELCRLYLEAVGWVGQASRCATRISAAARAIAAYAPRTAIAASGVSSPTERCTVMAACTAVPGRY